LFALRDVTTIIPSLRKVSSVAYYSGPAIFAVVSLRLVAAHVMVANILGPSVYKLRDCFTAIDRAHPAHSARD
jgi:hypothetical protein